MTPEAERYRDQLRAMLPELAERFGVSELGLFGSRIRGDHRPDSDLDVLVSAAGTTEPRLRPRDRTAQRQNRRVDVFAVEAYISRPRPSSVNESP